MGVLMALILGAAPPAPAWASSSVTFVQATIVAPDAGTQTLGFVDASGRSRSHRVTAEVAARFGRLRAGDEVILVLAGSEPVVQEVRLSQAAREVAEAAARDVAEAAASEEPATSPWTVVPPEQMRVTWPNPYSRFYRGARPARRASSAR